MCLYDLFRNHDGVLNLAAPNSDFNQVVLYLGSTGALKCR